MEKTILDYPTVTLSEDSRSVVIIDQTHLPGKTELIQLKTAQELWDAIYLLKVRGAPAIGVAAAYGLYVLSAQLADRLFAEVYGTGSDREQDTSVSLKKQFYEEFTKQRDFLNSARPTAVNLSWALARMDEVCKRTLYGADEAQDNLGSSEAVFSSDRTQGELTDAADTEAIRRTVTALRKEAVAIQDEDIDTCKKIGEYGLSLLKPGDGILTHCNAGQLATSKYGTATAPIYLGQERGYHFRVFADETRPLLQGARLTSYELFSAGVDVTLICDNMSGTVMKKGWVNAVFVGCDRVAANGDTANKIGTSVVAAVASYYHVPFYVCAPTSTIDLSTPTGSEITIEERPDYEVTEMWYEKRMAPEGVKVFNPAFDVTDHSLITAIITEYGIAYPPFAESLKGML